MSFFGLFGNNKKKTPETQDSSASNRSTAQESSVKTQVKTSASKGKQKSPATPKSNNKKVTDQLRPGPNGCFDILTREED